MELRGEDATDVFRFDKANLVSIGGCLERVPLPIRILAVPKVFIATAKQSLESGGKRVKVDVTIRNTMLNSATCTLSLAGQVQEMFVAPETSQTRTFLVRLEKWRENPPTLELYKFEEAMAGAYEHVHPLVSITIPR